MLEQLSNFSPDPTLKLLTLSSVKSPGSAWKGVGTYGKTVSQVTIAAEQKYRSATRVSYYALLNDFIALNLIPVPIVIRKQNQHRF